MSQRRWSRLALAVAPLLALAACDQVAAIWERMRGEAAIEAPGPIPLEQAPLEARAISGSVQPADLIAGLLAPEPLRIAPGQILVGAQVEAQLAETAGEMGLARSLIQGLRAGRTSALETLPDEVMGQLRQKAEQEASAAARDSARMVLERLGISGEIEVAPGGVVTVNLAPAGVSPTAWRTAQQGAAAAAATPAAIEWNMADRCPRLVTAGALEEDLALATRCAIARLQASGRFDYVEPNYIAVGAFSLPPWGEPARQPAPSPAPQQPQAPKPPTATPAPEAGGLPNDPLLALQWHLRPNGAGAGQSPGGAGFESYWLARQTGSRQVRVAVIDTGLDLSHPDIAGSGNIAPGVDLISDPERAGDGGGVDDDAQDAGDRCGPAAENSFHGTHVAGTIGAAGANNRVGIAGGAWAVTVTPVRVLGRCGGELADIVGGIRWAAGLAPAIAAGGRQIVNPNPADILNLSFSIQAPCPASMQAAIDAAAARGAVVVAAAGNKANAASLYAPANCNNVVVVAANDARGQLAFYSNFGPEIDILAPGGDVFADTDNDGRPDGVLSTKATQSGCYDPLNQTSAARCYYGFQQGTSMAAPHVSAALALIAAETGLRGRPLEDALFTRALSPVEPAACRIECARNRNASPIAGEGAMCMRPCGRGRLDLTRAAQTIRPPAPPG